MAVMLSVMMIILTTEFVHCAVGCTSAGATKKASLGESHTYHFCLCQLKKVQESVHKYGVKALSFHSH